MTRSFTHSLTPSRSHARTHACTHARTHALTHAFTHSSPLISKVQVKDFQQTGDETDYLNEIRPAQLSLITARRRATLYRQPRRDASPDRFKKRGRKWFNWSDAFADEEWNRSLKDPSVRKSHDEYGNVTVCRLMRQTHSTGRATASIRSLQESRSQAISDSSEIVALGRGGGLTLHAGGACSCSCCA